MRRLFCQRVGWNTLLRRFEPSVLHLAFIYMPICLTSVVCKILEIIVKANTVQYLKTASILSDAQHGFMPRCSYLTNLIEAEELITGMTDQGEPVDVVYLDFSKAFDSPCHRLLVC